jgi:hypothetical protein
MIKIYVYYHEGKIYKISGLNESKEGLETQELTFETVPTEQQIIEKFRQEKGL